MKIRIKSLVDNNLEQPLPENGACNLGSINLAEYVINPYTKDSMFDFDKFKKDVAVCIRALDDVLEEGKELHALEEQREMARNYRNIGLGIMGYGTALMSMGIAYGSEIAKKLTKQIMEDMFNASLMASAMLAKERGVFPKYDKKILCSEIFKYAKPETMKAIMEYGLRNCSLLSIAPSGSIGTCLNVSTGLEPYYSLSYQRKTESLHGDKDVYYTVEVETAKKARKVFGDEPCVSAMDINWRDRVEIQGIMQEYIDTAISSTVNVKEDTSVEELRDLYLYAWEQGLKGITIYREGSFEAILSTKPKSEEDKTEKDEEIKELKRGEIAPKPDNLIGDRFEVKHGCGSYTLHVYRDPNTGKIFDCWINSKSQGCTSNVQTIAVTLSLLLRAGVPLERIEKALNGTGSCPSFMVGKVQGRCSEGKSCGTAIIQILKKCQAKDVVKESEIIKETGEKIEIKSVKATGSKRECPECGATFVPEGGCWSCPTCGYTKCGE